jgi:hypothetical protein
LYSAKLFTDHHSYLGRKKVLEIVARLGIPLIDIHEKVFEVHSDPRLLFPLRVEGHYNSEGYSKVAQTLIEEIETLKYAN